MAPVTPKKSRKRARKKGNDHIGLLTADVFNMEIPVYVTEDHAREGFAARGIQWREEFQSTGGWTAKVIYSYDQAGSGAIAMIIPHDVEDSTIVHELVHVVDIMFDWLGVETSKEVTEVRAYLMGHFYKQTKKMLSVFNEAYSKALEEVTSEPS